MRGVTAGDYSFARDPAVGVYVDDVYHSTLVGANIDLADIESIEVRRGPQGTLAGNASIAGSISINSKQPRGDDGGFFSASYGSYNAVGLRGAYDTAISDKLFMRSIHGQSLRKDGYVDQLDFTCGDDTSGAHRSSPRISQPRTKAPSSVTARWARSEGRTWAPGRSRFAISRARTSSSLRRPAIRAP